MKELVFNINSSEFPLKFISNISFTSPRKITISDGESRALITKIKKVTCHGNIEIDDLTVPHDTKFKNISLKEYYWQFL